MDLLAKASIPTCQEALPAGVHGQEYQTGQRLQPSPPHCTSIVFHYSSFHVRRTIGLIQPTWTQSCCSANGASLASASSKDFYLLLSKLFYPLLPLPSRCSAQPWVRAFAMGCWYQAAIQRGKMRSWEHQALAGQAKHIEGIVQVRRSEQEFAARARRGSEGSQMFTVVSQALPNPSFQNPLWSNSGSQAAAKFANEKE